MKQVFTFLAGVTIILSSCSSSRQSMQTPDDVYYSPGTQRAAGQAGSNNQDEYYSTRSSTDNYVRMKAQDQSRWSYFDDYSVYDSYYAPMSAGAYYGGSSFGYGLGFGYSALSLGLNYWDPYFGWNSYFAWNTCYNPYFYNPYYGGAVIVKGGAATGGAPVYSHLRTFNPASYRNAGFANRSSNNSGRMYRPVTSTSSSYYTNQQRSSSILNRFGITNGNNNNGGYRPANNNTPAPSFSQPSRSFSPSPSSGGSSGGGGGGGGISRPGRH